jgi:drug/metabolite transporter (DMT)-like permease
MTISNSLVAGVALVMAGGCGLARHFLLEPKVANYPQAPRWLLTVFFGFATVLIFLGARFLLAWHLSEPSPPGATSAGACLGVALLIYKGSLLINVLRQRLPSDVWIRLNRVTKMARCAPRRR